MPPGASLADRVAAGGDGRGCFCGAGRAGLGGCSCGSWTISLRLFEIVEGHAGGIEASARQRLPPPHGQVAIDRVDFDQPCLAAGPLAAISVVPLPPKLSSTTSPRREQSRIASATIATGLTVGCIARSVNRSAPNVFAPGSSRHCFGCGHVCQVRYYSHVCRGRVSRQNEFVLAA